MSVRSRITALFSLLLSLVLLGTGIAAAESAPTTSNSLTVSAESVKPGESLTIDYSVAAASDTNWVGIYPADTKPGDIPSRSWQYVTETSGTLSWNGTQAGGWTLGGDTPPGEYSVYLLANGGYEVLSGPVNFTILPPATDPGDVEVDPEWTGTVEVNVLTFNIWHSLAAVGPQGAAQGVSVIEESGADIVFLQESSRAAAAALAAELGWHVYAPDGDVAVISRFPIIEFDSFNRWAKAVVQIGEKEVTTYSGHLEYRGYSVYWPRGYGGEALGGDYPAEWRTWNKLTEGPVTDTDTLLQINEDSRRPHSAELLAADAGQERAKGRLVIFGGDFNEASSLDWTDATANLYDHNGAVVPWQTTRTLLDAGYVDSFRKLHPDPATQPGMTWPANNEQVGVDKLAWAPEADERDRIDYIFYHPDERIQLEDVVIFGPDSDIIRSQREPAAAGDPVVVPESAPWPSDHKAVLATFTLCVTECTSAPDLSSGSSGSSNATAAAAVVALLALVAGVAAVVTQGDLLADIRNRIQALLP